MNALSVLKYGGSSVGTPEKIQAISKRIADRKRRGEDLVVVVSAMGNATDELQSLARAVHPSPPAREMDMLLSAGERISMSLLSMALDQHGIPAVSFTGSQVGIITDDLHGDAQIKAIRGDRVREALGLGSVVVVAGFQGVSAKREITTLGRGGSDTTAVALSVALRAERCEIFTDVDGVFSGDPRKVKNPRFYGAIDSQTMVLAAYAGAQVLHPRAVEIASIHGKEIWLGNSLNMALGNGNGTLVTRKTGGVDAAGVREPNASGAIEAARVSLVVSDASRSVFQLELARPGIIAAVVDVLTEAKLLPLQLMVWEKNVFFLGESDRAAEWEKALAGLQHEGFLQSYEILKDSSALTLVGDLVARNPWIVTRSIDLLRKEGIEAQGLALGSLEARFVVPRSRLDDAVSVLHTFWIEQAGETT